MQLHIHGVHECTEHPPLDNRTMHGHNTYEIFYLLSGDADFRVEGNLSHLQPGDLMLMRKGEVHIYRLRSSAPYERMHINFDLPKNIGSISTERLLSIFNDRPLGVYNHYQANLFPNNRWFDYMDKICHTEDPQVQLCYLLPMLSDLQEAFETVKSLPVSEETDPAIPIISLINANPAQDLSLEILAKRFYLSKTHLNRIFKQSTGTTVWEYITIKRLFMAKDLIASGKPPTDVYSQCGFKDYTTFFRSYKQHFGVSPKLHSKIMEK